MDVVERFKRRRRDRLVRRMREESDPREAGRLAVIIYILYFNRMVSTGNVDADEDIDWITVNGTKVPLKKGKAVGGGKLKGKNFNDAKSEKKGNRANSSDKSEGKSNPEKSLSTKVSATGANVFSKGFSKGNLRNHWSGKSSHRRQYPNMTKQEYAQRALDLIQQPVSDNILGYKNSDNQVIRYDKITNDFVKGNPDVGIATMFKPSAGERYFQNQMKKEGEKQ